MARSIIARTGTAFVLALLSSTACDRPMATEASFARGSNNGNGKGPNTTTEQPKVTISPTQLTLSVGEQGIVTATLYDKKGNAIPVTEGTGSFFGCLKLAASDPDCRSIISILPGGINNERATLTGLAPGTVEVYAGDGSGVWASSIVTVK